MTSATRGCSHGFAGTGSSGKPEAPPPQPRPLSVYPSPGVPLGYYRTKKKGEKRGLCPAMSHATHLPRRSGGASTTEHRRHCCPAPRPPDKWCRKQDRRYPPSDPVCCTVAGASFLYAHQNEFRPRPRLLSFPRPGSWGFYRRTTTTLTTCSICSS